MSDFNFTIPGLMAMQSPVSDSLPAVSALAPHHMANSPWQGIELIGPVTLNEEPMPSAAVSAVMEFCRTSDFYPDEVIELLTSADGHIVITDAAAWTFEIPDQPLELESGMWYWRVIVTAADDSKLVVYSGTIILRPS